MKNFLICILLCIGYSAVGQSSETSLDSLLVSLNNASVPYLTVDQLHKNKKPKVILDSRDINEFKISHIDNSICVGYDRFNLKKTLKKLPKDKTTMIVIYCSLGIRSEDIGEHLQDAGYSNVYNLYGGIFQWKNKGYPIVDSKNQPTQKVHAFSKEWGVWLNQKESRVYE